MESKAGVVTFLAGVWLIIAPPALHFDAADIGFRPYRVAMAVAVVVMLIGMVRAMAPSSVPWLGAITFVLGLWLGVSPFVGGNDGASRIVELNQVGVGALIVVTCVVTAVATKRV